MGIPDSISDDISLDQLKAKRTAVEGDEGLDAANKKTVLNLLDKAIEFREHADKINRQRDEISQTITRAPDRLKKIQSEIDEPIPTTGVVDTEASTLSSLELEQRLQQEETEVSKRIERIQAQLKKLEEDYALSRQRVDTIILSAA